MLYVLFKDVIILAQMTFFEARRFSLFPTEVIAVLVNRCLDLIFFITFWLLVTQYGGVRDISPQQVISYYLIINGIASFFFTQLGIGGQLIKLIRRGEFNQALIRPINPILVPWSQRAGRNALTIIIGGLQVIVGILLAGSFRWDTAYLLPFVLFNTVVINICLNVIVGCLGFYFIEATGIRNAFLFAYELMGGLEIPLFLMPAAISAAFQFTPFPAAQYHLTILLQGITSPSPYFVFIGCIWAIALIGFTRWLWRVSLNKYEGVGI